MKALEVYISWAIFSILILILWLQIPSYKKVNVQLTGAQLISMKLSPVVIVPLVLGKRIVVYDAALKVKAGNSAFQDGSFISLYSGQFDPVQVLADNWPASVLLNAIPNGAILPVISGSRSTNVSDDLTISTSDDAFTSGNGTATVTVRYYLV